MMTLALTSYMFQARRALLPIRGMELVVQVNGKICPSKSWQQRAQANQLPGAKIKQQSGKGGEEDEL